MAFLAAFAESFGAILLGGRPADPAAAFLIVATMAVAVFGAHGGQDSPSKRPPGCIWCPPCSSCSRARASGRWTRW
jgi:hypothetical protein